MYTVLSRYKNANTLLTFILTFASIDTNNNYHMWIILFFVIYYIFMKRISDYELFVGISIPLPEQMCQIIHHAKTKSADHQNYHELTPHITLYLCRFDQQKHKKLSAVLPLQSFSHTTVTLASVQASHNAHKDNYFFSLLAEKSNSLVQLHHDIISIVNPIRENLQREKDKKRIANNLLTPIEVNMINKYGYTRVMECFEPHVTLGEGENKTWASILQQEIERFLPYSFDVTHVAIDLYGIHHQTKESHNFDWFVLSL